MILPILNATAASASSVVEFQSSEMAHPDKDLQTIKALLSQRERWALLSKNAALIAGMKLPPNKSEKFKDLIVARDQAESDARDAANQAGLSDSKVTEAENRATAEVNQEIKDLLGDADYKHYGQLVGENLYLSMLNQNGFSGYFVDAGVPLTVDQASTLATFAFQLSNQVQAGESDPGIWLRLYQQKMLDQASQVLSADQLAALRNYYANDDQLGSLLRSRQAAQSTPSASASPSR